MLAITIVSRFLSDVQSTAKRSQSYHVLLRLTWRHVITLAGQYWTNDRRFEYC